MQTFADKKRKRHLAVTVTSGLRAIGNQFTTASPLLGPVRAEGSPIDLTGNDAVRLKMQHVIRHDSDRGSDNHFLRIYELVEMGPARRRKTHMKSVRLHQEVNIPLALAPEFLRELTAFEKGTFSEKPVILKEHAQSKARLVLERQKTGLLVQRERSGYGTWSIEPENMERLQPWVIVPTEVIHALKVQLLSICIREQKLIAQFKQSAPEVKSPWEKLTHRPA